MKYIKLILVKSGLSVFCIYKIYMLYTLKYFSTLFEFDFYLPRYTNFVQVYTFFGKEFT